MIRAIQKMKRGFTLVELIVVVAITTLISSIVVVGSSKFDGTILLTNLAYDVALSVREAQFAGLNVKVFQSGGTSTFNAGYGITFYKLNADTSTNNKDYILFADVMDGNGVEDYLYSGNSNGGAEFVRKYSTQKGNWIDKFCGVVATTGVEECGGSTGSLTFLNIVFVRPNPDATFKSSTGTAYKAVKIYVKSPQNITKAIRIESTGQISVCSTISC